MAHRSVVPCVLALAALALPATARAAAPTADFVNPVIVKLGEEQVISTSGSVDPDGGFVHRYAWNLDGDPEADVVTHQRDLRVTYLLTLDPLRAGAVQTGDLNQAVVYLLVGDYVADNSVDAELTVTDNQGESSVATTKSFRATFAPGGYIRVHNTRPYVAGATLNFEAETEDADGDAVTVAWDLDNDGTFNEAAAGEIPVNPGGLVTRVFAAKGVYTVTARLTDAWGAETFVSKPITISNVDLAAELSAGTIGVGGPPLGTYRAADEAAPPRAAVAATPAPRTVRAAAPTVARTVATSTGATVSVQTVAGARTSLVAYIGAKAVGRGTAVANSRGVARVKIRLTKAGRKAVRKGRKLVLRGTAAGRTIKKSVRVRR